MHTLTWKIFATTHSRLGCVLPKEWTLRNWSFLLSHALSVVFALLTTFTAWWVPWKADLKSTTIKDVVSSSKLDLATPLPWLVVVIIVWAICVVKSSQFSERLRDVEKLQDNYDLLDKDYYLETELHKETKESYFKSLRSSLKYILCQAETGFSEHCRVSVYRLGEGDNQKFRNIFRFASQYRYDSPGRDEIPINQGVAGLSYATSSLREFLTEKNFQDEDYKTELSALLDEHEIELPPENTRMPSCHVIAKTISDIASGDQVGVIVYESTSNQCLSRVRIEELLTQEDQNISRFIKHLAVLDAEFSPG